MIPAEGLAQRFHEVYSGIQGIDEPWEDTSEEYRVAMTMASREVMLALKEEGVVTEAATGPNLRMILQGDPAQIKHALAQVLADLAEEIS